MVIFHFTIDHIPIQWVDRVRHDLRMKVVVVANRDVATIITLRPK